MPPIRSRKALWLLALLILRNGRAVSREWLAGTLWPDADQSVAFANLRPVISELRRALGDQGFRLLSPERVTLAFDVEGADIDVTAFDQAIRRGDLAVAAGAYGGPLLEDCSEEWVPQERNAREQECARALQNLADGALASGDFEHAIAHYQRLVRLDPWRDAARRGLMRAFAKSGDVNAALQIYREYAQLLRAEGGLSPDAQTADLYQRLRDRVRREAATMIPSGRKPPASSGSPTGVAAAPGGREDGRFQITAQTAPEVRDGIWLVPLESLMDGGRLASQVRHLLGMDAASGEPTVADLAHRLQGKRLVLILDS